MSSQKPTTNHKNISESDLESEIIYDTINDIIASFERLEILVRFFPEQMRFKLLFDTPISSLLTTEPHKVINGKIKTTQSHIPIAKLSNYISASNKMEFPVAIAFLKELVVNTPAHEYRKSEMDKE